MTRYSIAARLFTAAVVSLGVLVLASTLVDWRATDPVYYTFCVAMAILSAGWKVGMPAIPGVSSIGIVFILLGIVDFTLQQTLLIGGLTLAVQSIADRPKADVLAFRFANLMVAITVSYKLYHSSQPAQEEFSFWGLLPAVVVFGLMNTFPAAVERARNQKVGLIEAWHECGFWAVPHHVLGASLVSAVSELRQIVGWNWALGVLPVTYVLYWAASRYLGNVRATRAGTEILANSHHRTLETLGLAISARFQAAKDEVARMQTFAFWLADDMRLSVAEREALRLGSTLRDVGTLAVPEQIICKSGRLTREEFEKVKVHPVVGASIVEQAEFPYPVAEVVRSHHERWDGQGYPDGLAGNAIPVAARILAVVDCLVALTSDRPYRKAISLNRALSFIASQSGQAFDPAVVERVMLRAADFQVAFEDRQTGAQTAPKSAGGDFMAPISDARRESQQVFELAQDLGRSLSLSETLATFTRRLDQVIQFDALVVYILRDDVLVPQYVSGRSELRDISIPNGYGACGAVSRTSQPTLNADPSTELVSLPGSPLKSVLAIPLEGEDGTLGILAAFREERQSFTQNDLRVVLGVRGTLASAVENAIKYKEVKASATTDHLTGLPNSASLFKRLQTEVARCGRSASTFTVLVCDLDGFKSVNDRFGHLAGNDVLRAVADCFHQNCREYDYVARLGGDEFVVVLPGLPEDAVAARVQHLSMAVAAAAETACPGSGVGLSTGKARYPADDRDIEGLLATADANMYEAKRQRHSGNPKGYDFDWLAANAGSEV